MTDQLPAALRTALKAQFHDLRNEIMYPKANETIRADRARAMAAALRWALPRAIRAAGIDEIHNAIAALDAEADA